MSAVNENVTYSAAEDPGPVLKNILDWIRAKHGNDLPAEVQHLLPHSTSYAETVGEDRASSSEDEFEDSTEVFVDDKPPYTPSFSTDTPSYTIKAEAKETFFEPVMDFIAPDSEPPTSSSCINIVDLGSILTVKHELSPHTCSYCQKEFDSLHTLAQHAITHCSVSMPRVPPSLTRGARLRRRALSRQISAKTRSNAQNPRKYKCESCDETFRKLRECWEHKKESHPVVHQCTICSKILTKGSILKRHIEAVHDKVSHHLYLCPQCGRKFKYKGHLNAHIASAHERTREWKCQYCQKIFYGKRYLEQHESTHTKQDWLACPHCGVLRPPNNLKSHVEKVHKGKRQKCNLCQNMIHGTVRSHLLLKHAEVADTISLAEAVTPVYLDPETIKRRSEAGSTPKPRIRNRSVNPSKYKCESCDETFASFRAFWEHKKESHPVVHQCTICSKIMSRSQHLLHHIRVMHGNDYPYICVHCGRRFKAKSNLTTHVESVHERTKEWKCQYCDKLLYDRQKLRDHENIHLKRNMRQCPHCGVFRFPNNLRGHIKKVHEGMRRKCNLCGTIISGSVRSHLLLKHSEVVDGISTAEAATTVYLDPETIKRPSKAGTRKPSIRKPRIRKPRIRKPRKRACKQPEGQIPNEDDVSEPSLLPKRECHICKNRFIYLEEHISIVHSKEVTYKCSFCDRGCQTSKQLQQHVQWVHLGKGAEFHMRNPSKRIRSQYQKSTEASQRIGEADPVPEPDSVPDLSGPDLLLQSEVQKSISVKCPYVDCGSNFVSSEALTQHINALHPDFNVLSKGSKLAGREEPERLKVPCPECGKLRAARNLKRHIEHVHQGKREFSCEVCNKSFQQKGCLRLHIATKSHKEKELEIQNTVRDLESST